MPAGRRQRGTVNRSTSEEIEVTSGVPQEYVPGPILLLIFVNKLTKKISSFIKS